MNNRRFIIISTVLFAVVLFGCNRDDSTLLNKMNQIKKVGDSNPREALSMLDSLNTEDESEYVQMKYDLLSLRLHDKADDIPSSDIVARKVMEYFENNGNGFEKQEAYYYTGSVYRDLKDTPRALENFYKSVDVANDGNECDSLLLRNAYSWISFLLWNVQDYQRSNDYAHKEYEVAKDINNVTIHTLMHLGVSYQYLDSLEESKKWLDMAYNKLLEDGPANDVENVYNLLYNYTQLMDYEQATACYQLSKKLPKESFYMPKYLNLGYYFYMINQPDSAISCYKRVIDDNYDLFNVFDASKALLFIYYNQGNYKETAYYANIFRNASECLDLGKRQELAATVNNQYQYHLDKDREMQLVKDKERDRTWLVAILSGALLIISLLTLFFLYRRNRHLKETVRLSNIAESYKKDIGILQQEIGNKIIEIRLRDEELTQSKADLSSKSEELSKVHTELNEKEIELENNKAILADKIEQNKSLFSLIHKVEFEKNANEIVNAVKKSSVGMKNMKTLEWEQFYAAVDRLYPDFKSMIIDRMGRFSEKKLKVCYLMKIGLSNAQIQNITEIPRTTLWRYINKFNWILTLDDKL